MAFWDSWQLWEKLCFILAAGIVIVIILGCGKLVHNSWRIRKHTRERAGPLATKRALMHSQSVKRGRAKDIPFGIRALEKGVVVEGVWNSGANTPVPSLPGSPILSGANTPPRNHQDTSAVAATSTQTKVEIYRPSERLDATDPAGPPARSRRSYEPRRASGLRISSAFSDAERGSALAPRYPLAHDQNLSIDPSPPSSISQASSPTDDTHLHPAYHLPSSAASYASHESNPFLTPPASRTSHEEAIPLSHLNSLIPTEDPNQDDPAVYHSQLLECAQVAYDTGHAHPPALTAPYQNGQTHYAMQPGVSDEAEAHANSLAGARQSFSAPRDHRASQVVRKINSGFEILAPGTFDTVGRPSSEVGGQWREVKPAPPPSIVAEDTRKKTPRKLQKKGKKEALI